MSELQSQRSNHDSVGEDLTINYRIKIEATSPD